MEEQIEQRKITEWKLKLVDSDHPDCKEGIYTGVGKTGPCFKCKGTGKIEKRWTYLQIAKDRAFAVVQNRQTIEDIEFYFRNQTRYSHRIAEIIIELIHTQVEIQKQRV